MGEGVAGEHHLRLVQRVAVRRHGRRHVHPRRPQPGGDDVHALAPQDRQALPLEGVVQVALRHPHPPGAQLGEGHHPPVVPHRLAHHRGPHHRPRRGVAQGVGSHDPQAGRRQVGRGRGEQPPAGVGRVERRGVQRGADQGHAGAAGGGRRGPTHPRSRARVPDEVEAQLGEVAPPAVLREDGEGLREPGPGGGGGRGGEEARSVAVQPVEGDEVGVAGEEQLHAVAPDQAQQPAAGRLVQAVVHPPGALGRVDEERGVVQEEHDALPLVGLQVGLQPAPLRLRLGQGAAHDVAVQHHPVHAVGVEAEPGGAEDDLPAGQRLLCHPGGGAGGVRLIADVHVAGGHVRAQPEALELRLRAAPGALRLPRLGVLVGHVPQVHHDVRPQRPGQAQGPLGAGRELAHGGPLAALQLGVQEVMGVAQDEQLEARRGQERAVEERVLRGAFSRSVRAVPHCCPHAPPLPCRPWRPRCGSRRTRTPGAGRLTVFSVSFMVDPDAMSDALIDLIDRQELWRAGEGRLAHLPHPRPDPLHEGDGAGVLRGAQAPAARRRGDRHPAWRSTDGGRTWDETRVVATDPGMTVATPPRWSRPARGRSGCCCARTPRWRARSDPQGRWRTHGVGPRSADDGLPGRRRWRSPGDVKRPEWPGTPRGPATACSCASGRLVVPCDHRVRASTGQDEGRPSHLIYSDDRGATWQIGGVVQREGTNKSAVAELGDGSVYLNCPRPGRARAPLRGLEPGRRADLPREDQLGGEPDRAGLPGVAAAPHGGRGASASSSCYPASATRDTLTVKASSGDAGPGTRAGCWSPGRPRTVTWRRRRTGRCCACSSAATFALRGA